MIHLGRKEPTLPQKLFHALCCLKKPDPEPTLPVWPLISPLLPPPPPPPAPPKFKQRSASTSTASRSLKSKSSQQSLRRHSTTVAVRKASQCLERRSSKPNAPMNPNIDAAWSAWKKPSKPSRSTSKEQIPK